MTFQFQKASKKSARLRMALIGPAGSGKTYTALNVASNLGGKIAVIDTERGSASKYSDLFNFDVLELDTFHPQTYIDAMKAAEQAGYGILVIDSLSHAWMGKDGALEQVDRAAKRSQSGNSFGAWRDVTPLHNALVDAILGCRCHVIATMRAKTEYVQEKDERTGRTQVRKVGLAPVQRDGLEYEFDVVADLDQDNNLLVGKTRCPALIGGLFPKAGVEIAGKLADWLSGELTQDDVDRGMIEDYAKLLDEGEKLGITRKELPANASSGVIEKYITGLSAAIERKKNPPAPVAEPAPAEDEAANLLLDDPHPLDDVAVQSDVEMPKNPLVQAVHEKVEEATKPKQSNALRAFYAAAKDAGLDISEPARPARMAAVNEWLGHNNTESVDSLSKVDNKWLAVMADDIRQGLLKW